MISDTILCIAIKHGDQTEWNLAWKTSQHLTSRHPVIRRKLLKAMTCTTEKNYIKQLLSRAFQPDIKQKSKETMIVMKGLAENLFARSLTINYIIQNWKMLKKQ